MNINQQTNFKEINSLLIDLESILENQGTSEWLKPIKAILHDLANANSDVTSDNFISAKSTYKNITNNARGFSEYNIWCDDYDKRLSLNKKLDEIRTRLWVLFDL